MITVIWSSYFGISHSISWLSAYCWKIDPSPLVNYLRKPLPFPRTTQIKLNWNSGVSGSSGKWSISLNYTKSHNGEYKPMTGYWINSYSKSRPGWTTRNLSQVTSAGFEPWRVMEAANCGFHYSVFFTLQTSIFTRFVIIRRFVVWSIPLKLSSFPWAWDELVTFKYKRSQVLKSLAPFICATILQTDIFVIYTSLTVFIKGRNELRLF